MCLTSRHLPTPTQRASGRAFEKGVTKTTGEFTQAFPDVSLLRVRTGADQGTVYTLIHNKAFKNVRFIFAGDIYREPSMDDLHILKGVQGSPTG